MLTFEKCIYLFIVRLTS